MVLETSGGGGQHQTSPPAPGRPLLASPAPAGAGARLAGRSLRVHQQPHPSQGPRCRALCCCALCCCCVTPHTRPTSLPSSERSVAALKARHPSRCPPLRPCVAVGLRALWALLLAYNVGRLKARLRAGITARPKELSGIPAPLGGPSCGGGPGSAGACARHVAPHIGPSRAGAGPLVGTPGPHPVKQCRPAGSSVPPSPPLLSEWGQVGRCSLHGRCGSGKATGPRGKKSCGPPAKGNEGERPPTGRGMPHRRTATQGQDKPPAAGLAWRSPARQRRKQGCAAPVAAHRQPTTHRKKGNRYDDFNSSPHPRSRLRTRKCATAQHVRYTAPN